VVQRFFERFGGPPGRLLVGRPVAPDDDGVGRFFGGVVRLLDAGLPDDDPPVDGVVRFEAGAEPPSPLLALERPNSPPPPPSCFAISRACSLAR
jgi:hypothetical protein